MYYITNYERWWKYEKSFNLFKNALKKWKEVGDEENLIEWITEDKREVVWPIEKIK